MITSKEQPIQLDALYLYSPDKTLPKLNNSFISKLAHEIKSLFYSFIINYNAIGNVADSKESRTITVWVGTGRDQANTMKSLIDESFTKKTGINVNLMLVEMGTLLQATLSGQGPDVAMQVGNDLPMDYAMRGAVVNLAQFEDFENIAERFNDSALVPYQYNNHYYALPETQTFDILFYRKDIMKELGLKIPETWDELKTTLSTLNKNHMEFGLRANPEGTVSDMSYGMFLYQNGGEFYREKGKASALDSDVAVHAFSEWTKFYTDYTLTRQFDFVNRFRTGEVPLGIADYLVYNTLQVSAPEIKGLWAFTSVPGTVREDGTIDRTVPCGGNATIMMEKTRDKKAAWEFLKWWTSADIQTKFGREMEGLMGPAARYPTANIEALKMLPWPTEDFKNLSKQFSHVKGIPQVPGGYYTSRNIVNAFVKVAIDKSIGPREALMDNVRYINDEIRYKRQEFKLDD